VRNSCEHTAARDRAALRGFMVLMCSSELSGLQGHAVSKMLRWYKHSHWNEQQLLLVAARCESSPVLSLHSRLLGCNYRDNKYVHRYLENGRRFCSGVMFSVLIVSARCKTREISPESADAMNYNAAAFPHKESNSMVTRRRRLYTMDNRC
jgi:hypothetical protein